jgi:outer membrane biosynthesis protein TonB
MSAADTLEDTQPAATPRLRQDGWTPERQRRFLESIAEGHTVEDACRIVGLSVASAYAFRRRAAGAGFALGWHGANLLARDRVADTLLARALHGQTETGTRPDGGTWSRHRYDNSLATRMLARLDAQADAPAAGPANHAARMVAQEFDGFLDLLARDAGPARAALFLAARAKAPADVEPVVALARADRFLQAGAGLAAEVDLSDCDPAQRATWTADQWQRAEAAGLLRLAHPGPEPEPEPTPPEPQLPQLPPEPEPEPPEPPRPSEPTDPVWWCDDAEEWRTRFPPPPGFEDEFEGRFGEADYERPLTPGELEQMLAHEARRYAADHDAREAWFDALWNDDVRPGPQVSDTPAPDLPDTAPPEPAPPKTAAPEKPLPRLFWNATSWPMAVPTLDTDGRFHEADLAALVHPDALATAAALAAQAERLPDDVAHARDGWDEPARPPLVNPCEP